VSNRLSLDEAVEALMRDPTHAVRARLGDMIVELRVVPKSPPKPERSAAEVLREVGPWEGESYEELVELFAGVRQRGSRGGASLLGLFKDEPEIVDEAMGHVHELRRKWPDRTTQVRSASRRLADVLTN
jgi:hypothetical protein